MTREVDLVEEVGRIYGFDKVPDNASVPMAASTRPKADRVLDRIRDVLTSAGFDEAVTASLVPEKWSDAYSPWSDQPPLTSSQPMLGVLEKASQNIGTVNSAASQFGSELVGGAADQRVSLQRRRGHI